MSILNNIKSGAISFAENFVPVLQFVRRYNRASEHAERMQSKFKETGVLTPTEFVVAGDHMVHHCPTWQWSSGDSSKTKQYLPPEKQFLVTKNVPCYRRCKQMEYDPEQEKILEASEDIGEGWVDTHHFAPDGSVALTDKVSEMHLDGACGGGGSTDVGVKSGDNDEDEGPAMDMEDMDEMMSQGLVQEDDPNALDTTTTRKQGGDASTDDNMANGGSNIVETRTYDMNITYDKYYQVPRMWLSGYDEKRKPLTVDQMYEDFSEDHAKKTITMETHPHLPGPPMASIHPCRHAEVMKRLIEQLAENGKDLEVHHYLLIFMKFVQAVIPTIEYDYTRNVDLS